MSIWYDSSDNISSVAGLWGLLPDEVVLRIFAFLSPKDVVRGVGATCHALRRIAVSRDLWVSYTSVSCLNAVRTCLRNPWQLPAGPLRDAAT